MYHKSILLICTLLLIACTNKKAEYSYIENQGRIFNTTYSIKYLHTHKLQAEIEAELALFDDSLNPFKPTSIISQVNNNEEVVLDTFFTHVFNKAREVSQISDGLFDITLSPLINAWGFGFRNIDYVTQQSIDSLKQLVGHGKVQLVNGVIAKTDYRIELNTSAIAKGYAVDVISSLLDSYKIKHYMVEIGGEIRTKGMSQRGQCWQVGVTTPVNKDVFDYENVQTIVKLCNKSLATSGDYRNFYIKDGKKYAHTINPRTGYPSDNNILSATVIADDCMTADAYATVFMLADTAQTRKLASENDLAYMLLIGDKDDTYSVVKSGDFDSFVVSK